MLEAWAVATDEGTFEMTTAEIDCPSIESRKVYSRRESENANNEALLATFLTWLKDVERFRTFVMNVFLKKG
jgi:hypothetical protein